MKLKDNEKYLFKLHDSRRGKDIYFQSSKEAHRVAEACCMLGPVRELFNTDYPMPHIEDAHYKPL